MTDTVVAGCSTVAWDSPTSTVQTCVVVVDVGDVDLSMLYADNTPMVYADDTAMEYAT